MLVFAADKNTNEPTLLSSINPPYTRKITIEITWGEDMTTSDFCQV